tara:strand:- start:968 stop:1423 length:456 start_codon:yes stop_codon:yes gene_type:complete
VAFAIKTTLESIQGYLAASGYFHDVQIGEPKQPPAGELAAAIYMSSVNVVLVFANGGTRENHQIMVRIYLNMLSLPEEDIEKRMAEVVSKVTSDLIGDADQRGTVMTIDVGGMHGPALNIRWGHVDVGGTMYRVADMLVPVIVDDSGTVTV